MLTDHTLKCWYAIKANVRSLAFARDDNARSWPRTADNVGCFTQILSNEVSEISIGPFAVTGANQNRFHAGVASAFHVALLVANQKRAGEIDIMISHGVENHFGRWLATFATVIRQMRTKISHRSDRLRAGAQLLLRRRDSPTRKNSRDQFRFDSLPRKS